MIPIKEHGLIGEVLVAQRKSDEHSMQRLLRLPSGKSARSTYGSIKTYDEHYGFTFTLAQMHQGKQNRHNERSHFNMKLPPCAPVAFLA
jgi:mevalonate pyrophosphate decarboxylase